MPSMGAALHITRGICATRPFSHVIRADPVYRRGVLLRNCGNSVAVLSDNCSETVAQIFCGQRLTPPSASLGCYNNIRYARARRQRVAG